jgi:hypothetical protein
MKTLDIETGRDREGRPPLCPHCGGDLGTIRAYRSHLRFLANLHVYACPQCRKALGVAPVPK